ncbi:hypothetical protein JTE90_021641 [Oedothorax gibbosus]|uniref:Centrosome-associated FAM110 C-terminal domain-containing protein n=1 Tax=Oedothorax gibbosus TaxID=931172 RepID=A0AAV6VRR2_9ARAC|nr:hypothetical protein JTE90_021641 [Oedothorax gibbosus]
MSAVLRASNSKKNSASSKFGFEMVCNDNSPEQKIVNRRSAVERLEETKADYVKTERVLDCKQNFEYSSNLHVSTGPQIDVLLKSRVKSLYNCQNILNYVHSITVTDDNVPSFTSTLLSKNFDPGKSPELRENCTLQRKEHARSHRELNFSTDVDPVYFPRPPSRGRRPLPQPNTDCSRMNVNSCINLSYDPDRYEYERECSYPGKLAIKIDHSDNDENSFEPSDESYTVDDEVSGVRYQKQSSRTSDYVSRSSSFKCSVSSDRVKNLVKNFETKINTKAPSTSSTSYPIVKSKPVTRSKSDVNCRFSRNLCVAPEPRSTTDTELERFFDTMGLDSHMFKSLTSSPRSPIHFFDNVSSVNSDTNVSSNDSEDSAKVPHREGLTNSDLRKHAPTETSIVEKNARVVKWLYNCHNEHRKSAS